MTDDNILSPPFPGEALTADRLYEQLGLLHDWVRAHADFMQAAAAELGPGWQLPAVPELPPRAAYVAAQPVTVQFKHWLGLRRLREYWDGLLRNFEAGGWDGGPCRQLRLQVLAQACALLDDVRTPNEQRELKIEQAQVRGLQHALVLATGPLGEFLQRLLGGDASAAAAGD